MAQPGQISGSSTDYSSAASSYSSNHASFPLQEEDNHRFHQLEFRQPGIEYPQHHYIGLSYRGNYFEFHDLSGIRDCTWYCVVLVFTFCVFVSMTLILGVYGAMRLSLGPKCSILLQPNPIFVQSIKVEQLYDTNPGLMLYGFSKPPQLDVVQTWSSTLNFSVLAGFHKDFVYFLNEGSQINISYRVNSPSSSVFLVIAQGIEGLSQWLEDPTYPNTTLSWNVIQGSGFVQQGIFKSASYYIAVGNLNSEKIEVQLALRVRSFQYNTTEAYYKCTFSDGKCSLNIMFPNGNVAVLNSFGPEEGSESDEWNVKVSYVPRWTTYIAGIGGTTVLILAAFNFLKKFQCDREDGTRLLFGEVEAERAPLLSCKDDDLSSLGSSYDSVSNNEEDLEDFLAAGSMEGKSRDGENDNNTCRLCAICFDAPRECFFLPCGHCVACFACGTRIAEADSTCPVCSRNLKKVRKIFTV
ncbi:E3 UBIQUITIN-PROTEIN LIGASE APD1-RELATED [Salix koriyanagi]|uniref:E3 UBIQUITIN-PROTEIN LIGASE APD1-RELATED n=1 Tax=Salix koriyanagi TaxID=2511006 RepID=A0A9Q0VG73_9ROSI|nr:E3 UBIQUITIN-PROTEIN LIGASE APD1-RELATED [Salix koriyanagi]